MYKLSSCSVCFLDSCNVFLMEITFCNRKIIRYQSIIGCVSNVCNKQVFRNCWVYSYFMWFGNSQTRAGGDSILNCCPQRHYPWHRNPCFITWSIEETRKESIVFANLLIINLFQFTIMTLECAGNSRNYWPANSSRRILYDVRARLENCRNFRPVNSLLSWNFF